MADMPRDAGGRNVFDRFADAVSRVTAKAWFFAGCLALVVIWAPSIFIIGDVDTWQLIINTVTTIVTFLLVALWQNSQDRAGAALHQKLNAVAAFMLNDSAETRRELERAIGVEDREGS
jgi:low affinity Fe/Cu permease